MVIDDKVINTYSRYSKEIPKVFIEDDLFIENIRKQVYNNLNNLISENIEITNKNITNYTSQIVSLQLHEMSIFYSSLNYLPEGIMDVLGDAAMSASQSAWTRFTGLAASVTAWSSPTLTTFLTATTPTMATTGTTVAATGTAATAGTSYTFAGIVGVAFPHVFLVGGVISLVILASMMSYNLLSKKEIIAIKNTDRLFKAIMNQLKAKKYKVDKSLLKTAAKFKECLKITCDDKGSIKKAKSKPEKKLLAEKKLECAKDCYLDNLFNNIIVMIDHYTNYLKEDGENIGDVKDFSSLMYLPLAKDNKRFEKINREYFIKLNQVLISFYRVKPRKRIEFINRLNNAVMKNVKKYS